MVQNWLMGYLRMLVLMIALQAAEVLPGSAQTIVPDETLGNERSIVERNNQEDLIRGGAQRGQNLFHSFQEFGIGAGQAVYFLNPSSEIQNILTRVTGNNPSEVAGTIGIRNGTNVTSQPNLFLINPQGILFSGNAALDIGNGAFIRTTANGVRFGTQGEFSATNPEVPGLLSVNPSAFFFSRLNPSAITSRGTGAPAFPFSTVPRGEILVVGGDIILDGRQLGGIGNRVELAAISGIGAVGLNYSSEGLKLSVPDDMPKGDVTLKNQAALRTQQSDIAIYARNLNVTGSSVLGTFFTTNDINQTNRAGDIKLNITDKLSLQQGVIGTFVGENVVGAGGNITINAGTIELGGASGITSAHNGQGDGGNISLTVRDRITLDASQSLPSASTPAIGTLGVSGQGKVGNITVSAGSLVATNGGGISSVSGRVGSTGDIIINARDGITLQGFRPSNLPLPTAIASSVLATGTGQSGQIQLNAATLDLKQGGYITTSTSGRGNAGDITLNIRDRIVLDQIAGSQLVDTAITSSALPQPGITEGSSGNITISTGTLTVANGAVMSTATSRIGNSGNITINARDRLTFDGFTPTQAIDPDLAKPSSAITSMTETGRGNAGNITISTGTVVLSNGGSLISMMAGEGNGGNVVIDARDQVIIRGRAFAASRSSIATDLGPSARGKAGDISITTGTLSIEEGGLIGATASGRGQAGNIDVAARDAIVVNGSAKISGNFQTATDRIRSLSPGFISDLNEFIASSQIATRASFGEVSAGEIRLSTGKLVVTNGGFIDGASLSGNSANITIDAKESVVFDGVSKDSMIFNGIENRYRSGLNNQVSNGGTGDVGEIKITTGSLSILNGAAISSDTAAGGRAGNIVLNARDRIVVDGQQFNLFSNISTSSGDTILPDGSLARGRGDAGTIVINTGALDVRNGSFISSISLSDGTAGNIDVTASRIRVSGRSQIGTQANTVDGGNVELKASEFVVLRGNSQISTNTGVEAPQSIGTGGNITVNALFLVAVPEEDSDITANARRGSGGTVTVNAQGIFGIQFRSSPTSGSDITASSETGASGIVTLNTPELDRSQGLIELPSGLADPSNQVSSNCSPQIQATNSFTSTGRGGIAPDPSDRLSEEILLSHWVTMQGDRSSKPIASQSAPIVEARSWKRDRNGDILLLAGSVPSQVRSHCP